MQLDELIRIIRAAGGGPNAIDYADSLLTKLNRLEATNHYAALIAQLGAAREEGDFRGRVLEVNFADLFVEKRLDLAYGTKQGMKGDVDFCWSIAGYKVFIEMKLLGQDKATRDSIRRQLDCAGVSSTLITEDTRDVARIQLDIVQKSSTRKFNPKPEAQWINLVGVDVSELQLGTVDICDCLLAAGGNTFASKHCDAAFLRANVVGVFESLADEGLTPEQREWIARVHDVPAGTPHPRSYVHGVLFLFREPRERAALSYALSGAIVWNPALVSQDVGGKIGPELHRVIPFAK
jgi:hypothetical protein